MSNAELFQAFQMFNQGVQQAATASAVNDATAAMQEIHSGISNEAEQRKALQQLSNQTAMRLTGLGASGTQIKSAFDAIAPQQFGSVEQMQLEADLSGSPLLQKTAKGILGARQQAKRGEMDYANKLEMGRDELKYRRDLEMAQMKSKTAGEDLKATEWEKLDEAKGAIELTDTLMKSFNALDASAYSPRTGFGSSLSVGNPERDTFNMQVNQWFDSYRHKITGAGAATEEITRLEKSAPTLDDSPWVFKGKVDFLKREAQAIYNRKKKTLAASGRNMRGFNKLDAEEAQEKERAKSADFDLNAYRITGGK